MELLDFLPSPTTTWGTAAFMHVAQNGRLGILGRQMHVSEKAGAVAVRPIAIITHGYS